MADSSQATDNAVDVQALFPWTDGTMQFAEQAYRSWLRGAETVQTQAMHFWNAELKKGIDAMNEIAQCATAAEAFGVQTRYAAEAMQGLIAESQKVVEQLAAFTHTPWATETMLPPAADAEATAPRSSRRRS